MNQYPELLTIGKIARMLDVPVHRIDYILRTRTDIKPLAVAGKTRLYDSEALRRIRYEVNSISARESARCGDDK